MTTEKPAFIPYTITAAISQLSNIYEVRLFGWILAKAQSVLKLYNADLGAINIQHAMGMAQFTIPAHWLLRRGDTNYKQIEQAFTLANKTVTYERDGMKANLNIIAFPKFFYKGRNKYVQVVIDHLFWYALMDFSKGYRLVDLSTYMSFRSSYSVIMYILVSQQSKPITYSIATLRAQLGASGRAYDKNTNFIRRCVDVAKRELDQYAPTTFDYILHQDGPRGSYNAITIQPRQNEDYQTDCPEVVTKSLQAQRSRLSEPIRDHLMYKYGLSTVEIERVEPFLAVMPEAAQLTETERIMQTARARGVKNPAGYLFESLRAAIPRS